MQSQLPRQTNHGEHIPAKFKYCRHDEDDGFPMLFTLVHLIITFTWPGPRGVAGYTEAHACAWHVCQPVLSGTPVHRLLSIHSPASQGKLLVPSRGLNLMNPRGSDHLPVLGDWYRPDRL
jgi:hypothetical protein